MIKLSRIKIGVIGLIFGLMIVALFNEKVNDFINLISSEEWRLILKIIVPIIFISITTLAPIGLFTQDAQTN